MCQDPIKKEGLMDPQGNLCGLWEQTAK